jgi:hypothetical protein
MLINKKIYLSFLLCCAVVFTVTGCYILFSPDYVQWENLWGSDKYFVFQLSTLFMILLSMVLDQYTQVAYIRFKKLTNILFNQIMLAYSLAFCLLIVVFLSVFIFDYIKDYNITILKTEEILLWYSRYYVGMLLITNIVFLMKWSNNKLISRFCILITFIIMLVEVLIITPELNMSFNIKIRLIFSWIFVKNYTVLFSVIIPLNVVSVIFCFIEIKKKEFLK